jgi:hypothetical protein
VGGLNTATGRAHDAVRNTRRATAAGVTAAVVALAGASSWPASGLALAADPSDEGIVAAGEMIYRDHCASCHGAELEGQPDWQRQLPDGGFPAPPHDADGHTWHHPDQLLFEITKFGGQALAPPRFKSNMRLRQPAERSRHPGGARIHQEPLAGGAPQAAVGDHPS